MSTAAVEPVRAPILFRIRDLHTEAIVRVPSDTPTLPAPVDLDLLSGGVAFDRLLRRVYYWSETGLERTFNAHPVPIARRRFRERICVHHPIGLHDENDRQLFWLGEALGGAM